MNKRINFFVTLLLVVVVCLSLAACRQRIPDGGDAEEQTLVSGFETQDDLYALTAIEIAPDDEYELSINTDKNYVSEGNASLRYTFASGGSHLFCQYIVDSKLPSADLTKAEYVSLDFFNPSDKEQKVTLSVTTSSGAALFSKQQTLAPNGKTTVVYDELANFSYKKKANVAGISFRFDVEEPVTLYVDNMRASCNAADVATIGFDEFIESITDVPQESVTADNFDENVAFVDAVGYAQSLYESLADKNTAKSANVDLLQKYIKLANGYKAAYSPRVDTDVVSKWEYGVGLTVSTDTDETYGAIWSIAVNAKRDGEQSFKFVDIDVGDFGQTIMYVYNPTDYMLKYRVSGGWQSFSAAVGELPSKQWSKIVCNAAVIENDTAGSLFLTIYRMNDSGVRLAFDGMFLFSAVYGEPAKFAAQSVVDMISALPDEEQIGTEHKTTVDGIMSAYEELSKAAKNAVDNYKKLEKAVEKIARIQAKEIDEKIASLVANEPNDGNVLQLYEQLSQLYSQINSLEDVVYDNLTKVRELDEYKQVVDAHLPQIVSQMIDGLPDVTQAEFPKTAYKISQILQLVDLLDESDAEKIDTDKLEKYKSVANNYVLLYDFDGESFNKISTSTDFGNSWKGTLGWQNDYDYGNTLVCNVLSGHSGDFSRNAEFRIRATSVSVSRYEKIFFYVYCPISDALFRCYPSNWSEPVDIALQADVWNKIEVDSTMFVDGNLDGMFFLFISKQGSEPIGEWKVSPFYGYVDKVATERLVADFVDAVNELPDAENMTIDDLPAVENAVKAYESLADYCLNYVKAGVLSKYRKAVDKAEQLKQAEAANRLIAQIDALDDGSDGEAVYKALYDYTASSVKNLVPAETVNKLNESVRVHAAEFAAALDEAVSVFGTSCDLPRDAGKLKVLSSIVNDLSDEVYALLSTNTSKVISALNKEAKRYSVVANVGGDVLNDEVYGKVYSLTLTTENGQNLILRLDKGVASGKNIVFYVYRPEGADDAFLYFAGQNNVWTSTDKTSVTVTSDGWMRVSFAAEDVANDGWTTYWYMYLSDGSVGEQSGWLISDIYAY